MKKILNYQLHDFKFTIFIYYLIFLLLFIFGSINMVYQDNNINVNTNGMEFSSVIFCFVCGICMFKEYYWLFAQNSVSRKTFVKGSLLTMVVLSIILSVVNQIFILLIKTLAQNMHYKTAISMIYNIKNDTTFIYMIVNLIFTFTLVTGFFFIGFLIAALFDRANKIGKIAIAAGLPIGCFMVLPAILSYFSTLRELLMRFFMLILGIEGQNPYAGITVCALASIILATIIYFVVKKAEIS